MARRAPVAALLLLALALAPCAPAAADGQVAGRVDFEDGSPAANATVTFTPGDYVTATRADGSFSIVLPAGAYRLNATFANDSALKDVIVREGEVSVHLVRIVRAGYVTGALNPIPFVFLIVAMVAVFVGGFYVNRRMAETGIDLNKSIVGGARVRKPFRRRRRQQKPPAPPT